MKVKSFLIEIIFLLAYLALNSAQDLIPLEYSQPREYYQIYK